MRFRRLPMLLAIAAITALAACSAPGEPWQIDATRASGWDVDPADHQPASLRVALNKENVEPPSASPQPAPPSNDHGAGHHHHHHTGSRP